MPVQRNSMYLVAICIALLSSASYHVIQRATPHDVHPIVALSVTYVLALLICMALLPFFPLTASLRESISQLNWTSYALAITVVGIEIGFLLAYRAGWQLSIASLIVTIVATLLLIPISRFIFHEPLSLRQILGIITCIVGLVLINWKE